MVIRDYLQHCLHSQASRVTKSLPKCPCFICFGTHKPTPLQSWSGRWSIAWARHVVQNRLACCLCVCEQRHMHALYLQFVPDALLQLM